MHCSVAEFLGCWAVEGQATLTLNTINGVTTVSFNTTLPAGLVTQRLPYTFPSPLLLVLPSTSGPGFTTEVQHKGSGIDSGLLATKQH